jgi:hypothetical protein
VTSPARPLSRARAAEVDRLVAGIADDMVSGKWQAGKSHRELAQREGVSVERVEDWATEAGRHLRLLQLRDPADLRARNQARLDHVYAIALDQEDPKAAVSALAEQAKLLGLNAPDRVQHAHVVATYEQLQPLEKRAQLVEAIAALQAELAELDAASTDRNLTSVVESEDGDGG